MTAASDQIFENIRKEVQGQRASKPKQVMLPETPVETAHVLLRNSDTTDLMPEVDQEVKLSNLDTMEKYVVYKNIQVFHDLQWMKREQDKKVIEAKIKYGPLYDPTGDEELIDEIEIALDTQDKTAGVFDKVGLLRMGLFVPVLSRGKFGFERTKQVETIAQYKIENIDKTDKQPGFMQRAFGGFKR